MTCVSRPRLALTGLLAAALFAAPTFAQDGYRTPPESPDFTSLPAFPHGLEPLQLTRAEMADYAVKARDLGIRYIGSCCGSVACHVRAMAKALGKLPAEEREWRSRSGKAMSAYEYYDHDSRRGGEDGGSGT